MDIHCTFRIFIKLLVYLADGYRVTFWFSPRHVRSPHLFGSKMSGPILFFQDNVWFTVGFKDLKVFSNLNDSLKQYEETNKMSIKEDFLAA